MKKLLIVPVLLALIAAPAASAHNKPHKHHKKHHGHGSTTPKPPIVVPPYTPIPPITPVPEVPQVSAVAFCATTDKGWTYVQLTAGAFNKGTYWRNLYDSGATVTIAGQSVKFINNGDAGIRNAQIVPGIGSTC